MAEGKVNLVAEHTGRLKVQIPTKKSRNSAMGDSAPDARNAATLSAFLERGRPIGSRLRQLFEGTNEENHFIQAFQTRGYPKETAPGSGTRGHRCFRERNGLKPIHVEAEQGAVKGKKRKNRWSI